MLGALDHWHADARGAWAGDGIGLGHLLLRTTPQSLHEALPHHDVEHDLGISGDLRLDNRAELAGLLSIAPGDLADWGDGRLVLRAYVEWGDTCPAHLLGDFAFAIWDGPRRRLFCARDLFGVKPFYFSHQANTLAFATEIKGLLALPFVDRSVNETWIADCLHRIGIERVSTFYAAIRRLEPGHTLTFDTEGLRTRQYGQLDPRSELRLACDEDYVEAFREKLVLAIRRRADTPFEVGAELSGGLDSSGICAIAQSLLRENGRSLCTFSQVRPPGMADVAGRPPDFRWAIDSLCRHAGITQVCLFDGAGAGDDSVLPALEWANRYHDEPFRDSSSLHNHGLYEAASERGVRILLSGFAGNLCVSAAGHGRLRELLWAGRALELWRELSAGPNHRHPLLRALRLALRECESPVLTAAWLSLVPRGLLADLPTTDGFARRMGMRRRTFRQVREAVRPGTLRETAIRFLAWPNITLRLEHSHLAAAARRIEYRYPLLDAELIALYLSLPSHLKYQRGIDRYVFRRSLEPWVPDDVRLESGLRASANPGNIVRKRRDEDTLKARVRALPPDSPVFSYVDAERLFVPPRRPGRFPRERHSAMVLTLALEHRLRQLDPGGGGPR